MKPHHLALLITVFSGAISAGNVPATLAHVSVLPTEKEFLSVQNLSKHSVEVLIHDESVLLTPASGARYQCGAHSHLALKFAAIEHEYFEVHCQSKVVINEQ